MERINQWSFYEVGAELSELRRFSGSVDQQAVILPVLRCSETVTKLVGGQPIKLGVSLAAAKDLGESLSYMQSTYFTKDGKFHYPDDNAEKIPSWVWSKVTSALDTFEHVFRAEMGDSSVYAVPPRGIYSTPELVENAQGAFPPEIHPIIGDKAVADYKSAGRCIAFNLPTAAAFHAMRAVEAVIEVYYQTFTNSPGATCNGWNDYAGELEKCMKASKFPPHIPDKRSIDQIKQMKDSDRNPVMHPRVTLSLLEADALFSAAKATMMNMALEIKQVWDAQAQQQPKSASLALVVTNPATAKPGIAST